MTTWVLLRGLTRESRHWGDFPQVFSAPLPGASVLALDLPGNGLLNTQRSPAQVEGMARWCHAELQRRRVAAPCCLLAMSLGAMVAVSWAEQFPGDLERCVLVNTSLRPFSPFFQRLRPRNYAPLLRLMFATTSPDEWEEAVLRLTSAHPERHGDAARRWAQIRRQNPVSRANAVRQLLAAARYRAPARQPPPRMLILSSDCDGLVDPRCSQRLAEHWGCDIRTHPDAGHDLPLDDAAWVAGEVARWIS